MNIGDIVLSLCGRDEGKYFIVVGTQDDYSMIGDGKNRRLEKPKRKNNKHLKLEDRIDEEIATRLVEGGKVTNNEIRKALAQYTEAYGEEGGM